MKKLLHIFSKENSVRGASLLLIVTLTLSNLLGLIRDHFLTRNVATSQLDIYYAAFRIPDLIFNILILGAISSAFIPVFSDYIAKKKTEEGFKMTSSLLNLAFLSMIFFCILMYFLMPSLTPLVVPRFSPEKVSVAVKYSRLLMITPIFFSLSYICGGVLNSFKRFVTYSMAPLVYNGSIIFGAVVLAPKYGLISVVYCVIAGSAFHFLVQLPPLFHIGFKYSPSFDFKNESIKRILRLMIPRTIGMGIDQIMLIIYTAIASALAAGSITAFTLANNIQTMPIVVFGTSFATAVFPTLTAKIAQDDKEGFAFYLDRAMRALAFLLIPCMALFYLLRAQIVRMIYGSGKFNWSDTKATSIVLGFFALSLLAQALIGLLARAFYALKNTRTPMYASISTAILSVGLGYPFAHAFGIGGLALAFSIANYFNAFVLLVLLRKKYPEIWNVQLIAALFKITLISLVMALAAWGAMHLAAGFVNMNRFIGVFEQTVAVLVVAGIVYFGLSYLFKSEEMRWVITRKINGNARE